MLLRGSVIRLPAKEDDPLELQKFNFFLKYSCETTTYCQVVSTGSVFDSGAADSFVMVV